MPTSDIHIDWAGPYSLAEARALHGPTDHGLYQYYGEHPVYGRDALLYLGKTEKQTFGRRLAQNNWEYWSPTPVTIYVGRLCLNISISEDEALAKISLAERILLFAHSPGFNTANLNNIRHTGEDVRVLNWGMRKSLFPEVSVSRWEGGLGVGHSRPRSLNHFSAEKGG